MLIRAATVDDAEAIATVRVAAWRERAGAAVLRGARRQALRRAQTTDIAGQELPEVAYGWRDLAALTA